MTRVQTDRAVVVLGVAMLAILVALGLGVAVYAHREIVRLDTQPAYRSPRTAMIQWQRDHGAERVEITRSDQEYPLLKNLWTVAGDVWLGDRDHGIPVCQFFLRTPRGWVLVPEGRHPGVIALGQSFLSMAGPRQPASSHRGQPTLPRATE